MSRCFPFPPKGYTGNFTSNEAALIVSIKLQEERGTYIPDRVKEKVNSSGKKKDRKRAKKAKNIDQKDNIRDEKAILFHPADESKKQFNDKSYRADSVREESKLMPSFDVLERSHLTEEHGRPVNSQNVPGSSDSTGNSSKRKRDSSPASSIQRTGNVIRIRLSSQKRDNLTTLGSLPPRKTKEDPSTSQTELRPFSSSKSSFCQKDVMPTVLVPSLDQKHVITKVQEPSFSPKDVMSKVQEPVIISQKDVIIKVHDKKNELREDPTSSGRVENSEPPLKKLSSHEKKMLKKESLYNMLCKNLVPYSLECDLVATPDYDDNWLFSKKGVEGLAKRQKGSDGVESSMNNFRCSASALIQPRAHFLSDGGVHALPFTVPF